MTEHDADIDFDFFDDLETGESAPAAEGPKPKRPSGGPPRKPEHAGIPPTVRLVGLIVFGILIIVLLVLWVQSCSGASTKSSYQNYLSKVDALATDSQRIGSTLAQKIDAPGVKVGDLAASIDSLAQQQEQDVAQAEKLKPPSGLAASQASLVEALRFRAVGLRSIAKSLRTNAGSTNVSTGATALAAVTQRLVASDVVWQDNFRTPVLTSMAQKGVTGVPVPVSRFLTDTGVDSTAFWTPVLERLNGAASSTGKAVGTKLLSVIAQPGNKRLSESTLTTVNAGTNLGFDVSVLNSGDVQVVGVKVTLTIKQSPQPITANQTISQINPGDTKVVKFRNLPSVNFVTQTTLTVDVKPVPGETNPNNNSATYPVIFSLTGP